MSSFGQFNVISLASGWKPISSSESHARSAKRSSARRYRSSLDGVELTIATAEDVLLAKLEWAKLGESNRQIDDAAEILKARNAELDHAYLHQWIRQLGVDAQWSAALRVAGIG